MTYTTTGRLILIAATKDDPEREFDRIFLRAVMGEESMLRLCSSLKFITVEMMR